MAPLLVGVVAAVGRKAGMAGVAAIVPGAPPAWRLEGGVIMGRYEPLLLLLLVVDTHPKRLSMMGQGEGATCIGLGGRRGRVLLAGR